MKPKNIIISIFLMFTLLALPACSSGPKPTPSPTPPVSVTQGSFADGTGVQIGFKLLYALDAQGGNGVLGITGLVGVLAAARDGADGTTADALSTAMGTQAIQPRQIMSAAYKMYETVSKLKKGTFTQAWGMFIGENQYVKESFITDCASVLHMDPEFSSIPTNTVSGGKYLSEWADAKTGGVLKKVPFTAPKADSPFFTDILLADPMWQQALDQGKSRPQPFTYEDSGKKAVPTLICVENSGLYEGADGTLAILPMAGDETRLVIMEPPEKTKLHDFMPVAAARYAEWVGQADWNAQRVLLPRFSLGFDGSVMSTLNAAGFSGMLDKGADYTNMGTGMYVADILHMASLVVDESGVDAADPNAEYRPGATDGIKTLAINRPFIVMLIKTDTGQAITMGFVRDPLAAVITS